MFLDEKIERLKKLFSAADFKVPFTKGSNILNAIEAEFIIVKDLHNDLNNSRNYHNHRAENIKHKIAIKSIGLDNHNAWLNQLDANTNYWLVFAYGNSPSLKHMLYDCKPEALLAMISITQGDFFIVDKKYKWFAYFEVNRKIGEAIIYRSGERLTLFDQH